MTNPNLQTGCLKCPLKAKGPATHWQKFGRSDQKYYLDVFSEVMSENEIM